MTGMDQDKRLDIGHPKQVMEHLGRQSQMTQRVVDHLAGEIPEDATPGVKELAGALRAIARGQAVTMIALMSLLNAEVNRRTREVSPSIVGLNGSVLR